MKNRKKNINPYLKRPYISSNEIPEEKVEIKEKEGELYLDECRTLVFEPDEEIPGFRDEDYERILRASQRDVIRIGRLINRNRPDIINTFQKYNIRPPVSRIIINLCISFTLDNYRKYSGNEKQKINAMAREFQSQYSQSLVVLIAAGMPVNVINRVIKEIIRFTIESTTGGAIEIPKDEWSKWENLGGIITSAPSASSWGKNMIDIFSRGTDNALYHILYDGVRWRNWESLGGVLTSAPGAVSWGLNRIDVFVRGTDNAMYHKWWDGMVWSDYENLGGILTSSPSASSWAQNRIDTFVRGTDNALYHKWWDGLSWSNWEGLGGSLTSAPGAVSWGPNRIDVFVRGTDNAMYHKWWDGKAWSNYENLGGDLTSAPCATSTGENKIECFARGINNNLIYKFWNGSRWSEWENLGGNLDSEPTAVSPNKNRVDVFARGVGNRLIHIYKI